MYRTTERRTRFFPSPMLTFLTVVSSDYMLATRRKIFILALKLLNYYSIFYSVTKRHGPDDEKISPFGGKKIKDVKLQNS
jgi:hypothetical protein